MEPKSFQGSQLEMLAEIIITDIFSVHFCKTIWYFDSYINAPQSERSFSYIAWDLNPLVNNAEGSEVTLCAVIL